MVTLLHEILGTLTLFWGGRNSTSLSFSMEVLIMIYKKSKSIFHNTSFLIQKIFFETFITVKVIGKDKNLYFIFHILNFLIKHTVDSMNDRCRMMWTTPWFSSLKNLHYSGSSIVLHFLFFAKRIKLFLHTALGLAQWGKILKFAFF